MDNLSFPAIMFMDISSAYYIKWKTERSSGTLVKEL